MVTVTGIISAIIVGLIIGALGRLVLPAREHQPPEGADDQADDDGADDAGDGHHVLLMSLGWNTGNFPGASHAHTISSDVIDDLTCGQAACGS
jgi:hypothetical protein